MGRDTVKKGLAMATTAPRQTSVAADEFVPSGWVQFAGIVLFISGFFSVIWGLAALLNDKVVHVGGEGVLIADFTTWGWVHLIVGSIMVMAAFGLFAGRGWARWAAVFLAALNACLQVGAMSATPFWSLFIAGLDIVVIYQLTAKWVHGRH